jgi:hypothetical protein
MRPDYSSIPADHGFTPDQLSQYKKAMGHAMPSETVGEGLGGQSWGPIAGAYSTISGFGDLINPESTAVDKGTGIAKIGYGAKKFGESVGTDYIGEISSKFLGEKFGGKVAAALGSPALGAALLGKSIIDWFD